MFGRPVIKIPLCPMASTLKDFLFHLEYYHRAFITLKILRILFNSSSNTFNYKKGMWMTESQIFICSAQVLIAPMFHSPATTGNQGFEEKQTGEREKSVHILCPVYNLSQS